MLHPFLFCGYLVLHIVAANFDETSLSSAWRPLLGLQVLTAILLAVFSRLLGSTTHAALGVTLLLTLLFSFEAVLRLFGLQGEQLVRGPAVLVLVLVQATLLIIGLAALRRTTRRLERWGQVLSLVALVMLALATFEHVRHAWRTVQPASPIGSRVQGQAEVVPLRPADTPPDIYLILLDAYARADILQEMYGFDNRSFVDGLQSRGFQVAPAAFSNYLSTKLALPSLLNFRYLDYLTKQYGPNYTNVRPLVRDIQNNKVTASLRAAGYRIVNITSDVWYASLGDPDERIAWEESGTGLSNLEVLLVDMTALRLWRHRRALTADDSAEERRRQQVLFNLRALGRTAGDAGPRFVFAHVMAPHDPFVFGPAGEPRAATFHLFHEHSTEERQRIGKAYTDQITYLNQRVLEAIDAIQERSAVPPIIVVLGDHGLRLDLRARVRDSCLRESFGILYAAHLPGDEAPQLPAVTTPVNTFRWIFDAYFGAQLGTLPDRAFFAHRKTGYYSYREVTPQVESCHTTHRMAR